MAAFNLEVQEKCVVITFRRVTCNRQTICLPPRAAVAMDEEGKDVLGHQCNEITSILQFLPTA